jgi:3alpha(or 20beta)-hydroxysteroid dehydrogenase
MFSVMGELDGLVAIVSGGARGMGASHVKALHDEGARVLIGDVNDEAGQALAESIGDGVRYIHLDVTDPDQWSAAVENAVSQFGSVDVLVNNAGIVNGNLIQDFELSAWQQIIDINLTGTFLGIRAVVPAMIAAGGGSIINVSSTEGLRGTPGVHGYVASKFAVRGLAKSTALELAPHGIRVNSIHPGLVRTPMVEGIPEDFLTIPLSRAADPVEVSNFVVFLACNKSSYATGAEFAIDGGLTTGVPHKTY